MSRTPTDWTRYPACHWPECRAAAGRPCTSAAAGWPWLQQISRPHHGRRQARPAAAKK